MSATDDGIGGRGEWMIRHDAGGLAVEPGHDKGDGALTGPAASLLLVLTDATKAGFRSGSDRLRGQRRGGCLAGKYRVLSLRPLRVNRLAAAAMVVGNTVTAQFAALVPGSVRNRQDQRYAWRSSSGSDRQCRPARCVDALHADRIGDQARPAGHRGVELPGITGQHQVSTLTRKSPT
ncbi:MAG: hypothetical protein ACRDOK_15885 [Streptosporangiaceae bacterium]